MELDVAGQGALLRSLAQRPLEVAVRDAHAGPEGIKHVMYSAVVPDSAMLDNRFSVDIPGHGKISVNLPPGKLPGDELSFEMPPPGVKLQRDNRPSMAQIMAVVNTQHTVVAAPRKQQPSQVQQSNRRFTEPRSGHPPRRALQPQEVRVEVPAGAVGGETLVVKGNGGGEYEVTVPVGVTPGSTFLAMLPVEPAAPQPAASMRILPAGRTTRLAGEDLADSVTSAVTDAVQDAVQQAATEVAKQKADEAAVAPAPAPAPAEAATVPEVEVAPPAQEPAPSAEPVSPAEPVLPAEPVPPAEAEAEPAAEAVAQAAPEEQAQEAQAQVVAPQTEQSQTEQSEPLQRADAEQEPDAQQAQQEPVSGLGHRDGEQAFVKGEPISAQEVPDEYEGEAMLAPDTSTNQYTVTVYEPLAPAGRRNRGIASTWNSNQEAWQFDTSKARAQADLTWLDEPGVWQEIDAYMGHKKPDKKYLTGGFAEEDQQQQHVENNLRSETR